MSDRISRLPRDPNPKNLELAGELADGASIATYVSKPQLEFAIDRVRAGAERTGRSMPDIKLISWAYTSISDDGSTAVENVRPFVTQALDNTSPEAYPMTSRALMQVCRTI